MSEEDWENLFNAVPDPIYIIDSERNILRANRALSGRLGLAPKDIVGQKCHRLIHGTEEPPDYCPHPRLLADGREHIAEVYEKRFKGHYLVSVSPLLNGDGRVAGSVHVARDITKRKLAENEANASRANLLSVLNGVSEPIMVIGLDRRVSMINQAAVEFTGCRPDEGPLYCYDISHRRSAPCPPSIPCPLEEVRRTERPFTVVHEHFQKDGEPRYVEIFASPLRNAGGNITGIIETMRDITERRRAEEALRESEEKFRSLAEQSPNMIFINQKGRLVYINKRCEEITGYAKDEFYSPYFDFLTLIAPESREPVRISLMRHVADEEASPYECMLLARDGRRFDAIVTTRLISYGGESAILGIVTDITERKRMEENLRKYVLELENHASELMQTDELIKASLEEKDLLMREIHHRVKNNLAVISSLLNLQSAQIKDKEARELFKETQNRVRSMSMIHERLYLSSDLRNVSFSDYIGSLAAQLFNSYGIAKEKVRFSMKVPEISLDVNTMIPCGLILNELISNVLKHAFPRGKEGEVLIEVLHRGEEYTLSVKDNGAGVPADFDIQSSRTLGLQLVASLTKQLGGTIELIRDEGTEFRVTFREKRPAAKSEGTSGA
jgi:PAS domain S-box-containing protein